MSAAIPARSMQMRPSLPVIHAASYLNVAVHLPNVPLAVAPLHCPGRTTLVVSANSATKHSHHGQQYVAQDINIERINYNAAENNTADITMKCKPSEKKLIAKEATESGMKNSNFVRACVKKHLKVVAIARANGKHVTQVMSEALALYQKWQIKQEETQEKMLQKMTEGRNG